MASLSVLKDMLYYLNYSKEHVNVISITFDDGRKIGIGNIVAQQVAIDALIAECEKQIAEKTN